MVGFKPKISETGPSNKADDVFGNHGFVYITISFAIKNIFDSKEPKGDVPKRKGTSADKQEFSLFLLFSRLIEVRELWLFRLLYLCILVGLVVEFESVVGIS